MYLLMYFMRSSRQRKRKCVDLHKKKDRDRHLILIKNQKILV